MNAAKAPISLNILVVDDETMIAMFLDDMLSELGCNVIGPAGGVATALALIEANAAMLHGAMIDVNLRGELAYPVADALLRHGVPFVFVTGYAAAGIDPRYAKIPTMSKPFRFAGVERVVQGFMALRCAMAGAPGKASERGPRELETCGMLTSQQ